MGITSELFYRIVNNCLGAISALLCESQPVYKVHNVIIFSIIFLNGLIKC